MSWEAKEINDLFLVTDYVANGSFASLKENVTYLQEKDFAILIRTTDNTKGWNGNYVYVNENSYNFLSKSTVFPKDLIIANVGDPGKAFLCPDLGQPMTLGPNSILVRPLDKKVVDEIFFYYYTCSKTGQNQIQEICSATAQKKFNKTSYRKLKVPLPPLEEQKKIAAILDAADDYRQKTKALIDKYDQLTQSLFLDMFGDPVTNPMGWESKKLGMVHKISSGGTPSRKNPEYYSNGTIPWVKTGELKGMYALSPSEYITEAALNNSSAKLFPINTLLIAMYGATIGACSILNIEAATNQACAALMPTDETDVIYEYFFFSLYKNELIKLGVGGAQPNISAGILKSLNVMYPPLQLQNQFAERVAQIAKQKQQAEASLVKAEELFSSLLQRAFKGELTS